MAPSDILELIDLTAPAADVVQVVMEHASPADMLRVSSRLEELAAALRSAAQERPS